MIGVTALALSQGVAGRFPISLQGLVALFTAISTERTLSECASGYALVAPGTLRLCFARRARASDRDA